LREKVRSENNSQPPPEGRRGGLMSSRRSGFQGRRLTTHRRAPRRRRLLCWGRKTDSGGRENPQFQGGRGRVDGRGWNGSGGDLPFAPDLAVEVISFSDSFADVETKARVWLERGARLVWVVEPGFDLRGLPPGQTRTTRRSSLQTRPGGWPLGRRRARRRPPRAELKRFTRDPGPHAACSPQQRGYPSPRGTIRHLHE
jgi:hypothetical protein